MAKLIFSRKEKLNCEILGSIEVDGERYAVFFSEKTKEIYIYRYKVKKHDIKLTPIKNKKEFQRVCAALDERFRR